MDTGEIDYRRAERPPTVPSSARAADLCNAYGPATPRTWSCEPLLPAPLFRQNVGTGEPIATGQQYSIRIEHAVIADMIETPVSFRRLLSGRDPLRQVGEIAVLAHVFEFADSEEAAQEATSRFVDLTSLNDVKVVYFSPDVERGQSLNISNIPLAASRRYGGRPIGIQIIVLELDRLSGPMRSLMDTLAGLGRSSAAMPSGPAADALLSLGRSLLSQDNDDVIFEYRFVLDHAPDTPSARVAPFEAGRYVVRRSHERRDMQRWDNLILDHNTGQLMAWDDVDRPGMPRRYVPFEADTYFTLNIVNDEAPFFYDAPTLGEFNAAMTTAANRPDQPFADVARQAERLLAGVRNNRLAGDLVAAWRIAAAKYREYARNFVDAQVIASEGTCTEIVDANRTREREEALFQARVAADRFLALYQQRLQENSASTTIFTADVQRNVLSSLSTLFIPPSSEFAVLQDHLVDPAKFVADFTGANAANFHAAARRAAELNWAPRTCQALRDARLAQAVGSTG